MRGKIWKTLQPFLGLVVRPVSGAWNVLGLGVPGVAAGLLWAGHHALLALLVVAISLFVLVAIAGFRLQKALLAKEADQGYLETLGRQLFFGEYELDRIEEAGGEFRQLIAGIEPGHPRDDKEKEELDGRMKAIMETPEEGEWRQKVRDLLNGRLPHYYSALFDNIAGLGSTNPPEKVRNDEYWRDRWSGQEMRLQRLHGIIEELHKEWRSRWSP
jgi:hypothetical protein